MNPIYTFFVYAVWFLATYFVVLLLLTTFVGRDKLFEKRKFNYSTRPFVSVIVPAYNEAGKIKHTIESLKKIKYDKIEFIVVNDGSTDTTSQEVKDGILGDSRFRFIDRKKNMGKAASLNEGISKAKGEFIATIDADSIIEPGIFPKVLPFFDKNDVGAVTVAVRVKNPKSFMHKIFELEYIIGLSLMLKVFSFFNAIFVTPGPFSVYRKSVLKEIGGFDVKNITEDMEIAYRIQKHKYKIENCMDAKVYTIIPPTFQKLLVQRKRWYTGALITISKHRDMVFNRRYGFFGYFMFFNYALIFSGLLLFLYTAFLSVKNLYNNLMYYQYTNFNFLQQMQYFQLDFLNMSRTTILGLLAISFTLFTLISGMYFTRTKWSGKKLGAIGYPLLFFVYQLFWIVSFAAFIRGKKVKWR
jgi:cellulose synthase/poly-beta-1,6-N-acetylglucosamine synthase-like glycosyltransferase